MSGNHLGSGIPVGPTGNPGRGCIPDGIGCETGIQGPPETGNRNPTTPGWGGGG